MTRRQLRARRARRLRQARGAMLLFMLLVGLPIVWLAGALAVDYSRVVVAQRQAGQLADSASVAGALQLVGNVAVTDTDDDEVIFGSSVRIDEERAHQVIGELLAEADEIGAAGRMTVTGVDVDIDQRDDEELGGDPATVTVTLHYDVTGLLFLGLASDVMGNSVQHGSLSRTAFVCDPAADTRYTFEGHCTRPRGSL